MPDWKVPLADVEFGEGEIEAVAETYRSGWLSMGQQTEEFERRFAGYVGSEYAIAVANGTAALHVCALAAGLGEGDEVIVPSLTFVATVSAFRHAGATPVFADIAGLDRPWLSAEAAAAAIGDRTRAIVNMTYGGHPGESAELAALAEERNLMLIEDAAHGLGGELGGRRLGTFGDAGAFSFFANKNLPVGEGGMVVTDDPELSQRARLLRSHGMTTTTWDRHRGQAVGYDVVAPGFNYRIDEPRAALGIARLERLDADNAKRAAADSLYRGRIEPIDGIAPTMPPVEDGSSAHHLFTVTLDEGIDREAVLGSMAEGGVQTGLHYPPVHRFSAYAEAAAGAELPLTDEYARRAITLPLFPGIREEQVELVVSGLEEAVGASQARG
jgi:dTDP-4-amino-4,6-dideoxygalactose transaminase